jgi:opacity protein-like surface antigen
VCIAAALTCLLMPAAASAQVPASVTPRDPGFWGFNGSFGTGGAGGDFGNLFVRPVTWDYSFFRQQGAWRVGVGMTFASFKMKEPYQDELEWGFQQVYLSGTRMLRTEGAWRPYLQARAGIARLRPRSELFIMNPLPPDFVKGQATQEKTDGFAVGLVPGLELKISASAFLDAAVGFTYFKVSPYDLTPVGQPSRSSGTAWEGRLGITWLPSGEPGAEAERLRDAWGVEQSYGWAIGEVLAINNLSGVAAQFVRNVDWSETSPRSWWDNLKYGFAYDADDFKTNQFIHPFNGAAYYNAGRANGISFWPSTLFAAGGALEWECCGETQRMSLNDMFSTAIGGVALGEVQYRLSSEILDNQARGNERVFREIGAFLVDPVRGFNRVITGHSGQQADNPADPQDWRPPGETNFAAVGARAIGEGSSITHNTDHTATILLDHEYGNVFDNPRRKPYDYIDFIGELNIGSSSFGLENVQIRGNLFSWALGDESAPNHVLAVVQHFEYLNNTAYKFGSQSVGPTLLSRFRVSNRLALRTRLDGIVGLLLAGINSEYSYLADVPNPERLREYDYGPGLGAAADASLYLSGRPLLSASYRFDWVSVTNGSAFDKQLAGLDANHYIQDAEVRLVIPVKGSLGIGGDASVFLRDSDFTVTNKATGKDTIEHVQQRNPEARVFVSMTTR